MAFALSAGVHNSALRHCRPCVHGAGPVSTSPQLRLGALPPSCPPEPLCVPRKAGGLHPPTPPAAPEAGADRVTCTAQQALSQLSSRLQGAPGPLPPKPLRLRTGASAARAGGLAPPHRVPGRQMPSGAPPWPPLSQPRAPLPSQAQETCCVICSVTPGTQSSHRSCFKVHPGRPAAESRAREPPELRCPMRQPALPVLFEFQSTQ